LSRDRTLGLKVTRRLLWPQAYISNAALEHGVKLEIAKLPVAKRGFALSPEPLAWPYYAAFVIPMLKNAAEVLAQS